MVDEKPLPYASRGMDLDARDGAREHRDGTRQQRDAGAGERVGDAVREQCVDARPRRQDLDLAYIASGWIAVAGGAHVTAQLERDPRQ